MNSRGSCSYSSRPHWNLPHDFILSIHMTYDDVVNPIENRSTEQRTREIVRIHQSARNSQSTFHKRSNTLQ